MKVLIFGGTGFLGPHFVQALQAGGHQLTTTTVRDTLDWNNKRPAEQRDNLAVGLKPEREAELLKQLTAQR